MFESRALACWLLVAVGVAMTASLAGILKNESEEVCAWWPSGIEMEVDSISLEILESSWNLNFLPSKESPKEKACPAKKKIFQRYSLQASDGCFVVQQSVLDSEFNDVCRKAKLKPLQAQKLEMFLTEGHRFRVFWTGGTKILRAVLQLGPSAHVPALVLGRVPFLQAKRW